MALWFELKVNAERIGVVEIRRLEHLDLTDPAAIADAVSTYEIRRDEQVIGSLMHRYGDGAWRLLAEAADLIATEDGHAALHHGCAEYMAEQVRSLHSLDVVEVIAAAMRAEGDKPRTNGEVVQRLINLIADQIGLLPQRIKDAPDAEAVVPGTTPADNEEAT